MFVATLSIIYFKLATHEINTRNNSLKAELPKVRLEFARKSFYYMGAKLYNDLPKECRQEDNFSTFKRKIKYLI